MQKALLYLIIISLTGACSKGDTSKFSPIETNLLNTGWEIPSDNLVFSIYPLDQIQSIDSPRFIPIIDSELMNHEIAYVYRYKNTIRIYPEDILAVHEIVNDQIDDHYFSISYCPLTGSAVAWNRKINDEVTEFGVSGHLYNDNLIPYDRNSNSFWSQMQVVGIKGKYASHILKSELLLKTSSSTIHASFPNALVLIESEDHFCDSICHKNKDRLNNVNRLNKQQNDLWTGDYFGIIAKNIIHADKALLFSEDNFTDNIQIHQFNYDNSKMIIIGSHNYQFIIAFIDNTNVTNIQFYPILDSLPLIMRDNLGNKYDIMGRVIDGPQFGHELSSPLSYFAHTFAWDLFYPNRYTQYE